MKKNKLVYFVVALTLLCGLMGCKGKYNINSITSVDSLKAAASKIAEDYKKDAENQIRQEVKDNVDSLKHHATKIVDNAKQDIANDAKKEAAHIDSLKNDVSKMASDIKKKEDIRQLDATKDAATAKPHEKPETKEDTVSTTLVTEETTTDKNSPKEGIDTTRMLYTYDPDSVAKDTCNVDSVSSFTYGAKDIRNAIADNILAILVTIALCIGMYFTVYNLAKAKHQGTTKWLSLSLLLTPVLVIIILQFVKDEQDSDMEEQ